MNQDSKHIEEKEEGLIDIMLHRFVPYWPLFLILLVCFVVGAWVQLHFSTPIYRASATLIISAA